MYGVYRAWLLSKRVLVLELFAGVGLAIGVALLFASQVHQQASTLPCAS